MTPCATCRHPFACIDAKGCRFPPSPREIPVWPEHPGNPQVLHVPPGWTEEQTNQALATLRGTP